MKTIALLNTSIMTTTGTYTLTDLTLEEAKQLIDGAEIDSAIGHQSTAAIMTELLGVPIPVDRKIYIQEAGAIALVFKLNGRPKEGTILSRSEIEEMGYKFQKLVRTA